ncbi:unnamed protein product [Linum tenue]|uniref:MULE transposase domain-containing protein n=1 Tax=Linum tenue TaxID=586396 RepID=A0AAV0QXV2_9ROSI|nr:unnamed protein product [Linum tenue]
MSAGFYDTKDKAREAAKEIAKSLGFFLIVSTTKRNPGETNPRIYMDCNHGCRSITYIPDPDKPRRNNTKAGKLGCRFRVVVQAILVDGSLKWRIDGVRGFHNHKFELYFEGSSQRNTLTKEKKEDIKKMEATMTQPKQMKKSLNDTYDAHHNMKQIYNEIGKIRLQRLGGMKPMQWTLGEAQKLGYFIECEFDIDHHVTNLFLCHPESLEMLSAWYFVVLIDSTYKTNKHKKPLVQLVSVTLVQKNFNIGFASVADEKKETYTWVLSQLKSVFGGRVPNAIVTDKEGVLGVAVREIFPESTNLLCVWHMKKNIEAKLMSFRMSREVAEGFVGGPWGTLLYANTQEGFDSAWVDLQNSRWGDNGRLINYLRGEWLSCARK